MSYPDPPVTPRPAATILLVRDGADGLEVFMATRHQEASFMPGLLVFPGGRVDESDGDPRIVDGLADEDRTLEHLASRIGGIREAFEEADFLFARDSGGTALISAARLDSLSDWRRRVHHREATLAEMTEAEKLSLAPSRLVPFAHWVTPRIRHKRFDTRFYLAEAPHGQEGAHDQRELVDSRWVRPLDAVAEADRGDVRLAFVTRSNLKLLARSPTVSDALRAAAERRIVTVSPEPFDSPDGPALRIPADAGYDVTEVLVKDTGAG